MTAMTPMDDRPSQDDEEDSQTGMSLMGDDLFFQSWHGAASFVREET